MLNRRFSRRLQDGSSVNSAIVIDDNDEEEPGPAAHLPNALGHRPVINGQDRPLNAHVPVIGGANGQQPELPPPVGPPHPPVVNNPNHPHPHPNPRGLENSPQPGLQALPAAPRYINYQTLPPSSRILRSAFASAQRGPRNIPGNAATASTSAASKTRAQRRPAPSSRGTRRPLPTRVVLASSPSKTLAPERPVTPPRAAPVRDDSSLFINAACIICFEKLANVVLLPCNHLVICSECANAGWERGGSAERCPVCRQPVGRKGLTRDGMNVRRMEGSIEDM